MKIVRILNDEGIASPRGKLWNKPTVHNILRNEAHLGTLVWGNNAKDGADPVRVEKAFPATVTKDQFDRVNRILRSRAPKVSHPRRVGSTFLLSGLVKCYRCKRALSGRYSSRGTFPYYVCHSFVKRAPGSCDSPRVDARQFEELVVGLIRSNILTEGNIRSLVNVVDEQMDDVAGDERKRLGDHPVGACRREGQTRPALRPRGDDDRVQHGRLRPPHPRPQGASGAP